MTGHACARVGTVTEADVAITGLMGETLAQLSLSAVRDAWQGTRVV
jgi:hypothetical protein